MRSWADALGYSVRVTDSPAGALAALDDAVSDIAICDAAAGGRRHTDVWLASLIRERFPDTGGDHGDRRTRHRGRRRQPEQPGCGLSC
jgi:hypothetical protein